MFTWFKSLFVRKGTAELDIPVVESPLSSNSARVRKVLIDDGRISGRDIKEICGNAYWVKKCINDLRDTWLDIKCIPHAIEKKGGKHTFAGSCVEYVLQ